MIIQKKNTYPSKHDVHFSPNSSTRKKEKKIIQTTIKRETMGKAFSFMSFKLNGSETGIKDYLP
jgi:hypothetical protein